MLLRLSLLLAALILFAGTARATEFVVTTPADTDDSTCGIDGGNNDCTLREAIFAAFNNPGEDSIRIAFSGIIELGSELLALSDNITILGNGVTVKRKTGGDYSVFTVSNGATVTLNDLILSDGGGAGINGGAIKNSGTLTLNKCVLSNNSCTFSDGTLTGGNGGAINNSGTLTVNNCTFKNNAANKSVSGKGGFGGAISNGGTLEVNNSTFNHNTTSQYGGGIFNDNTMTLDSSTFTDNEAAVGGGALSDNNGNETFHINFCTIAGNRCLAADGGGGLDFTNNSSTVSTVATLTHTILAGNTANGTLQNYETGGEDPPGTPKLPPPLTSHGYNLSDDAPSGFGVGGLSTGDQINSANVNLGALGDYGGPTQTIALLDGSAAINAGDPNFGDTPATDQRGFKRVSGGRIDIGAFEVDMAQFNIPLIVNNSSDEDDGACTDANCSLREAIADISSFQPRPIEIPVAGPIVLGSALPDLINGVTIQGTNPDVPTEIDGGVQFRHFAVATGKTATLSRLRLIRGHDLSNGGSLHNAGMLTINSCTLSGNSSDAHGGAINNEGTLTVNNSTFSGNSAPNGYAGAIFNFDKVTLTNCTFTDNDAKLGGGAMSDNDGNEIFIISHCTIAGNRCVMDEHGGGLDCINTTSVTLSHTILAGNTADNTLRNYEGSGTPPALKSSGYNLSDDAPSGLSAATHDLINKSNMLLDDLASNGGPTQTMALLSGSAALNTGNPSFSGPPSTDQRGPGFPRVQAGRIDIGAFESAAGVIAFSNATYQVNENHGTLTFNVVRTGGSKGAVSVLCSTSNSTALAGKDYTAKSATINFANGETAKTFTVNITNDALDEADETFVVTLRNAAGGAALGALLTRTATILDDDPLPLLSINNVTITEGNAGTVNATFSVTLNKASGRNVTVNYGTANGIAAAGSDYTAASGTLTFAPGQTSRTISVTVKGDLLDEPNETFKVNLSGAVDATISDSQGVGNISDNDPAPGLVGNVSTRLPVGAGDDALIEGFIVRGVAGSTKKIIVRAIGPSLVPFGIPDALANPSLEIHNASKATIATNNDWKTTQVGGIITGNQFAEINGSGVAPSNNLESAIIANLAPGDYTAVVRGAGNSVGTGVVDAYDLSPGSSARLVNFATRGLIQPGDKLMIAGFIIQNGSVKVVVRAIGPSLAAFGITNALPDTTLQLRNQNGVIVRENDDWQNDPAQKQELESVGLQPTNVKEAALVETIQPGQYTAQVRGKGQASGIGVVQVYFLQ